MPIWRPILWVQNEIPWARNDIIPGLGLWIPPQAKAGFNTIKSKMWFLVLLTWHLGYFIDIKYSSLPILSFLFFLVILMWPVLPHIASSYFLLWGRFHVLTLCWVHYVHDVLLCIGSLGMERWDTPRLFKLGPWSTRWWQLHVHAYRSTLVWLQLCQHRVLCL